MVPQESPNAISAGIWVSIGIADNLVERHVCRNFDEGRFQTVFKDTGSVCANCARDSLFYAKFDTPKKTWRPSGRDAWDVNEVFFELLTSILSLLLNFIACGEVG